MEITTKDLIEKNTWLNSEVLQSLPIDYSINSEYKDRLDVKLIINGTEVEASLYNDLLDNIEKHIDKQARSIILDDLEEAHDEVYKLKRAVEEAKNNIIRRFELDKDDY